MDGCRLACVALRALALALATAALLALAGRVLPEASTFAALSPEPPPAGFAAFAVPPLPPR